MTVSGVFTAIKSRWVAFSELALLESSVSSHVPARSEKLKRSYVNAIRNISRERANVNGVRAVLWGF